MEEKKVSSNPPLKNRNGSQSIHSVLDQNSNFVPLKSEFEKKPVLEGILPQINSFTLFRDDVGTIGDIDDIGVLKSRSSHSMLFHRYISVYLLITNFNFFVSLKFYYKF